MWEALPTQTTAATATTATTTATAIFMCNVAVVALRCVLDEVHVREAALCDEVLSLCVTQVLVPLVEQRETGV